ncbi:MAG: pyruvate formate lyase family protein, partial [Candidatus Latescibacteria bacterium]|nr:pyruvate formate lyase family protein [Candidatus Latescibacterota bacterium]
MRAPSETEPSARVQEAISSLCDKEVQSTSLERLRLTHEADARVRDLTQPLQLGEGVYYLLDRISVPVSPLDLILGRITEEVPDREGEAFFQETVAAWNGSARPPWMKDGGHECFAWPRLLQLGLSGLEEFAVGELERRASIGADEAALDFLRGSVRIYQAFRNYASRYAGAAREAGLVEPAARCAALALRPPQTFAEALQLVWLVGHPYCTMLASNPTLTFGRLDEMLLRFYEEDQAAGRLCRDEAGDLIEDFYCKNNLVLGRGEHQMGGGSDKDTGWARNLTYDAPQYVVLGGRKADGTTVAGDLTALFLE